MRDNIKTLSKRLIMIRDNFVPANCTQALELIDEAQRDFMTQIGRRRSRCASPSSTSATCSSPVRCSTAT